jgi:hypothetical protein
MLSLTKFCTTLNKMKIFAGPVDMQVYFTCSERVYREGEETVLPVRYNAVCLVTEV